MENELGEYLITRFMVENGVVSQRFSCSLQEKEGALDLKFLEHDPGTRLDIQPSEAKTVLRHLESLNDPKKNVYFVVLCQSVFSKNEIKMDATIQSIQYMKIPSNLVSGKENQIKMLKGIRQLLRENHGLFGPYLERLLRKQIISSEKKFPFHMFQSDMAPTQPIYKVGYQVQPDMVNSQIFAFVYDEKSRKYNAKELLGTNGLLEMNTASSEDLILFASSNKCENIVILDLGS